MIPLLEKRNPLFELGWVWVPIIFSCLGMSEPLHEQQPCIPNIPEKASLFALTEYGVNPVETLEVVFQGPYFSIYTSGKLLKQKKYSKSGIWNVPARKLKEYWVKRTGATHFIRLTPQTFRQQLVELLAEFPEIHRAILCRSYTYKSLPQEARSLNNHIQKVIIIRREKASFNAR